MRNEDVKSHLTWRTLDNKSNYWFSAATDKWLVLSIKYGSVSADIYLFAQKFRTCSLCTLGGWQSQRYSELRLMIWCSRALIRAIRQLFHYWLKNFNFPITQSIIYLSDMYCASCFVTCKKKKNSNHYTFLLSSFSSFCPTNSQKPKDSSFAVTSDKEMGCILAFKKLKPANVWHVC